MERVRALINKLQEQLDQHADPASMSMTAQMLQAELQQAGQLAQKTNSMISVVLPSAHKLPADHTYVNGNHNGHPKEHQQYQPQPLVAKKPAERTPEKTPEKQPEKIIEKPAPINRQPAKVDANGWLFHPIEEVPTLAHQSAFRELNDVIGTQVNGSSLNERLRQNSIELSEVLTESPIRDLKKGIGINDRYVFINDLFRGDETMYERSIKTINNFHIFQEAEFWIERELKLKLGWDETKSSVQHFYQLVKRRFS